jgi:hypothetical protein
MLFSVKKKLSSCNISTDVVTMKPYDISMNIAYDAFALRIVREIKTGHWSAV